MLALHQSHCSVLSRDSLDPYYSTRTPSFVCPSRYDFLVYYGFAKLIRDDSGDVVTLRAVKLGGTGRDERDWMRRNMIRVVREKNFAVSGRSLRIRSSWAI